MASSSLAFNEQTLFIDTLFVPLSRCFVVLINNLHRPMGRYVLCLNIRYVRVHTSTSDYLLSARFFFLSPLNEPTVTLLLETHNFDDGPPLNTTAMKLDKRRGPPQPWRATSTDLKNYEYSEQGFWLVTILLAKFIAGTYHSPLLPLVSLTDTAQSLPRIVDYHHQP